MTEDATGKPTMKNKDLFELEAAITNGCKVKHWALVKPLNKMLVAVKAIVEPIRDSLAPTATIKAFNDALGHLRAENAAEKPEVLEEKIRILIGQHKQAQTDAVDQKILERDMLDDVTEIALEPIAESLFHDGGMLRVEPDAYFTLSRLGLVKE